MKSINVSKKFAQEIKFKGLTNIQMLNIKGGDGDTTTPPGEKDPEPLPPDPKPG